MSDTLQKILADKREHVAGCKSKRPLSEVEASARDEAPKIRGFAAKLVHELGCGSYGLIAEIKKASPSKGLIRKDLYPADLAVAYERGGATCISVLTDGPYFQGKDEYLTAVRKATSLPVLRKDFFIDPYQVVEARALGADCILLIMAALSDSQTRELLIVAEEWDLDVLVEVHDAREMERAMNLRVELIGINNRNLKTLDVDLATTEELAKQVAPGRVLVAESGLYTRADLDRMARAGAECFLVGESLMRRPDVEAAVRELLGDKGPRPHEGPVEPSFGG